MDQGAEPWDDCKCAFGIDDDSPFEVGRTEPLPLGWELDEIDGSGARWVAVFRVTGIPTPAKGRAVIRWLQEIGAIKSPRVET